MSRTPVVRTLLLAVVLLGAPALGAPALAQNNTAVAVNTEDGSTVFKFAFDIKRVANDVVNPQNAAVAYASCEDCQTVAVAIQIVLVSGDPSVVAPENVAIAVNDQCDLCDTLALAYQFVFGAGNEPVHFTKEGKERLKEVKRQFKELENANLSIEEMYVRVNALAQIVNDVVVNEMIIGPPGQANRDTTTTTAGSGSTPTTAGSGSTTTLAPSTTTTTTTSTTAAPSTTTTSAPSGSTTTSTP